MTLLEPVEGTWACVTIGGRDVRGDLVGFSRRIAVVAFERAQPLAVGATVRLQLGVRAGDRSDDTAVLARVLHVLLTRDGRPAAAFTLPDEIGPARRDDARVPFDERVNLVVCDGRVVGDAHQTARAVDLSAAGMSVVSDRELPPTTTVLLRFTLPNATSAMQFRARVRWCRRQERGYLCGLQFTGLKGTQGRDIAAAVLALADDVSER